MDRNETAAGLRRRVGYFRIVCQSADHPCMLRDSRLSRRLIRTANDVLRFLAIEQMLQLPADEVEDAIEKLWRGAGHMRGEQKIGCTPERMPRWKRFRIRHVQRGADLVGPHPALLEFRAGSNGRRRASMAFPIEP